MQKPRIIVFTSAYHPLIGGAELAIEETADMLCGDFDFFVITHRMRRDLARREQHRGAAIIRLGFGTALDRMFLFPFMAAYAGFSLMRAKKRVVLWGVMVSYASLGALFIKLIRPRTPLMLTLQEGDSEEHLRRGKLGLVGLSWRVLLKSADEVTAISTHLARHAAAVGFSKTVSVISNGADMEKFKNRSPIQSGTEIKNPENPVVITTSRLVHKNGVDILIRAIAEVKKEISGIRCVIAGDGKKRASLERLARDLEAADAVVFLGAVAHRDIPRLLHRADIFVRASRSEGMGSSFAEALAAGLPVIGTAVGGITDIIIDKETGLFAAVDDYEDLAQKILLLIRDRDLAASIAQEGAAMAAARFSWDTISGQYRAIFERLCSRPVSVLIASPLLPPDLGGVAQYALHFAEEFFRAGHQVSLVSYARDPGRMQKISGIRTAYISLGIPSGIRHALFFCALMRKIHTSDVVLVLDQFSVGVPAALVCAIARVPFVTRMEGDFLWESYVERTRRSMTLADFWRTAPPLSSKERMIRFGVRWVLMRASRAVFSSPWRREMVEASVPGLKNKSLIIENVRPNAARPGALAPARERVILWAGRMLYLKNLDRLIRAFAGLGNTGYSLHLVGEGPEMFRVTRMALSVGGGRIRVFPPLSHRDLLDKMRASAGVAMPSLSDVGPHFIADAVAVGTPFLMTRESGYAELFSGLGLFVNPLDERDIAEKLRMLMDEDTQAEYRERMARRHGRRDWSDVAQDWLSLLSLTVKVTTVHPGDRRVNFSNR